MDRKYKSIKKRNMSVKIIVIFFVTILLSISVGYSFFSTVLIFEGTAFGNYVDMLQPIIYHTGGYSLDDNNGKYTARNI